MASATVSVALPPATITIIAPAQAASSSGNPSFPQLKFKITPHADLPLKLAPQNARGKGVEDNIKVVVPIGGKVAVDWHVNPKDLPVSEEDIDVLNNKVMIAVREWLVLNLDNLGIDHFDDTVASSDSRSELVLTPTAGLPSHSPIGRPLIPTGEPVAHLTKIDLALRWHYPATRGRKRAEIDADVEKPFSFEALFGDPQALSGESQESPPEPEESPEAEEIDAEAEVLAQVGLGMQKIMRLQMIRRFPYVFDGQFVEYQSAVHMPNALFDGVNRFITLSARFGTPLVGQCREIFEDLQRFQSKGLEHQVNAMARLPVNARPQKRIKADSQSSESQQSQSESQKEQLEEDSRLKKIADYLHELRLADEENSMEDRLYDALSHGVAAIGTARWMQVRQDGRTRMSAYRAFLREPRDFPAFLPSVQAVNDELAWDEQVPTFNDAPFYPPLTLARPPWNAPFDTHRRLLEPEEVDDIDDLEAEDCYNDDSDESLGTPHMPLSQLMLHMSPQQSLGMERQFDNALQLHLGYSDAWPTPGPSISRHMTPSYLHEPSHDPVSFHQPHDFPLYEHVEPGHGGDRQDLLPAASHVPLDLYSFREADAGSDLDDLDEEDQGEYEDAQSSDSSRPTVFASYRSENSEIHQDRQPRFLPRQYSPPPPPSDHHRSVPPLNRLVDQEDSEELEDLDKEDEDEEPRNAYPYTHVENKNAFNTEAEEAEEEDDLDAEDEEEDNSRTRRRDDSDLETPPLDYLHIAPSSVEPLWPPQASNSYGLNSRGETDFQPGRQLPQEPPPPRQDPDDLEDLDDDDDDDALASSDDLEEDGIDPRQDMTGHAVHGEAPWTDGLHPLERASIHGSDSHDGNRPNNIHNDAAESMVPGAPVALTSFLTHPSHSQEYFPSGPRIHSSVVVGGLDRPQPPEAMREYRPLSLACDDEDDFEDLDD